MPKRKRRSTSEFTRIYGSRERVAFVAALPCRVCWRRSPDGCLNAHIKTGGMGRKADYTAIIPLCAHCHAAQHGKPGWKGIGLGSREDREVLAQIVEELWQDHERSV